MKKQIKIYILFLLILSISLSACNSINERLAVGTQIAVDGIDLNENQPILPTETFIVLPTETLQNSDDLAVSLALTNEYIETLTAESIFLTEEFELASEATLTQMPVETEQLTETVEPDIEETPSQTPTLSVTEEIDEETQTATATLEPSITPTPEGWVPSATPAECLAARYVSDVNYPDGSVISAGEVFYKTWRFQNVGSCIWRPDYSIVYAGGFQLGFTTPVTFKLNVYQEQYVNLTIRLVAPVQNGTYRGDFKMMDLNGSVFGIGENADLPFYFIITVVDGENISP